MKQNNQDQTQKRTAQFVCDYRNEQPAVIMPQLQAEPEKVEVQEPIPIPQPEPKDETVPTIRVTLDDAELFKEQPEVQEEAVQMQPYHEEQITEQEEAGFSLWKRNNQPSKLYFPQNPVLLEGESNEDEKAVPEIAESKIHGFIPCVLILIAAFAGVVCFCMFGGVNLVQDSTQLNTFLTPVMMQNPQPFQSISQAGGDMTLQASVWRAVTMHGAAYKDMDDQGRLIVPYADVEKASKELFGTTYKLTLKQPANSTFFTYDTATHTYRVSPQSSVTATIPKIQTIQKKDGATVVTVEMTATDGKTPSSFLNYIIEIDGLSGEPYLACIKAA